MSFPESLKQDFDVLDGGPIGRILPCYRVRERKPFGREFMLRLLPDSFCSDKGLVDAFHDFFTRFAQISNKTYLAQVHSVVGAANRPVYVLEEFVSGISLKEFVDKRKDSKECEQDSINIISRVCEALHYAHQKDIFHLSISPDDILIDENNPGKVKLVGFGAQIFASKGKLDYLSSESGKYVAPEVFKRGVFGPKADVYSLAVTIKELLPEFSEASNLLDKATSATLKDRFVSARQFAANLKELSPSDHVPEPKPKVLKPTKAAKPNGGLQPILKVTTDPPGATVMVDGQEIGKTARSGFSFPWSPGKTISFEKLGYETETLSFDTTPENSAIQIKLNSAVKLFTNPWGATIKINGELFGTTTHKGLTIPWDKGEIVIEKSGFKTKKLSFAVPPTEPELIVELEIVEVTAPANHVPNRTTSPRDSKPVINEVVTHDHKPLKVITKPGAAFVNINERFIGVTTGNNGLDVPWDKGEIVIEKDGYKTKRLSFVTPPTTRELVVELETEDDPVTVRSNELAPSPASRAVPNRLIVNLISRKAAIRRTAGIKTFGYSLVGLLVLSIAVWLLIWLTSRPPLLLLVIPAAALGTWLIGCLGIKKGPLAAQLNDALFAACSNGNFREVTELIECGADPNAKGDPRYTNGAQNTGRTPLIIAIYNNHAQTVRALLVAGADPNIKDDFGQHAQEYAKQRNNTEILDLLQK